jgi:hypothetical protein
VNLSANLKKKIKTALMENSEAWGKLVHEKSLSGESCGAVPLYDKSSSSRTLRTRVKKTRRKQEKYELFLNQEIFLFIRRKRRWVTLNGGCNKSHENFLKI